MNSDDFEKRLERQSIRPIPGGWRREILQQAKAISVSPLKTQNSKLKTFLSELLWPYPEAWAGLAAVWLVILTLNFAMQEPKPKQAKAAPAPAEVIAALKEQRRLYLELAGLEAKEIAEPPRTVAPGPSSQRKIQFHIV